MYIVIAIISFGILIAVHELGHFTVAKLLGVRVNEFAIGMGPKLLKKQKGETLYTLRLLPVGGFCAMEGEDEDTGDARAFSVQPRWKRFLILIAGAASNFILGFLILLILYAGAEGFVGNRVVATADGFPYGGEQGIMAGDEIYSINGHRIYYSQDFLTFMNLDSDGVIDLTIRRNGQKLEYHDFELKTREYTEDGQTRVRYGLTFDQIDGNVWTRVKYVGYETGNFVRMIWVSLGELISGRAGLRDMSGVVGIVSAVNEVAKSESSFLYAMMDIGYMFAFIAVNLAVMNMLPIPALDGGRVFFLIVTGVIEKIIGRKLNPKYEMWIHTAGLVVLLGLMAVILVSDVVKLFGK